MQSIVHPDCTCIEMVNIITIISGRLIAMILWLVKMSKTMAQWLRLILPQHSFNSACNFHNKTSVAFIPSFSYDSFNNVCNILA